MATRSMIGVQYGDLIKAVYCHWDGYTEHNGVILQTFYNRPQASNLVALGDISSLGADIGEKHDFDAEKKDEDHIQVESFCWAYPSTTFYGRDRGETGTEYRVYKDRKAMTDSGKASWCEFFYLLDNDGIWWVKSYNKQWRRLDKEIDRLRKVHVEEAA